MKFNVAALIILVTYATYLQPSYGIDSDDIEHEATEGLVGIKEGGHGERKKSIDNGTKESFDNGKHTGGFVESGGHLVAYIDSGENIKSKGSIIQKIRENLEHKPLESFKGYQNADGSGDSEPGGSGREGDKIYKSQSDRSNSDVAPSRGLGSSAGRTIGILSTRLHNPTLDLSKLKPYDDLGVGGNGRNKEYFKQNSEFGNDVVLQRGSDNFNVHINGFLGTVGHKPDKISERIVPYGGTNFHEFSPNSLDYNTNDASRQTHAGNSVIRLPVKGTREHKVIKGYGGYPGLSHNEGVGSLEHKVENSMHHYKRQKEKDEYQDEGFSNSGYPSKEHNNFNEITISLEGTGGRKHLDGIRNDKPIEGFERQEHPKSISSIKPSNAFQNHKEIGPNVGEGSFLNKKDNSVYDYRKLKGNDGGVAWQGAELYSYGDHKGRFDGFMRHTKNFDDSDGHEDNFEYKLGKNRGAEKSEIYKGINKHGAHTGIFDGSIEQKNGFDNFERHVGFKGPMIKSSDFHYSRIPITSFRDQPKYTSNFGESNYSDEKLGGFGGNMEDTGGFSNYHGVNKISGRHIGGSEDDYPKASHNERVESFAHNAENYVHNYNRKKEKVENFGDKNEGFSNTVSLSKEHNSFNENRLNFDSTGGHKSLDDTGIDSPIKDFRRHAHPKSIGILKSPEEFQNHKEMRSNGGIGSFSNKKENSFYDYGKLKGKDRRVVWHEAEMDNYDDYSGQFDGFMEHIKDFRDSDVNEVNFDYNHQKNRGFGKSEIYGGFNKHGAYTGSFGGSNEQMNGFDDFERHIVFEDPMIKSSTFHYSSVPFTSFRVQPRYTGYFDGSSNNDQMFSGFRMPDTGEFSDEHGVNGMRCRHIGGSGRHSENLSNAGVLIEAITGFPENSITRQSVEYNGEFDFSERYPEKHMEDFCEIRGLIVDFYGSGHHGKIMNQVDTDDLFDGGAQY